MASSGSPRPSLKALPARVLALFRSLTQSRRRMLSGLLALMLLGAVAEWVTLSSVLLFLAVLSDPESLNRLPMLGPVLGPGDAGVGPFSVGSVTTMFLVAVLLSMAIRLLLSRAMSRFSFAIGRDLGVEVFRRILYQPFRYHAQHNSAEVLGAVNKAHGVATSVVLPIVQGAAACILSMGILVALLWINLPVALIAGGALVALYWAASRLTVRLLSNNSAIVARGHTARMKVVQEGVGGVRDLILEGAQEPFLRQFSVIEAGFRDAQARNAFISQFPRFLIEALGIIAIALLAVWISGRSDMSLASSIPVLGALALGAQRLLPQVHQVYSSIATIRGGMGMLDDLLTILRLSIQTVDREGRDRPAARVRDRIELNGISFRYEDAQALVLENIDLVIRRCEWVAIVGETGSGKSTLVDVIMGLLEPETGTIAVDGHPLGAESIPIWHRGIAHVAQHIFLLDESIASNIAFSTTEIDRRRLEQAAAAAGFQNVVDKLEDGFEARVGERGAMLSGGERQRLGIARALYKNADVLILDEATSALDDPTAARILGNIKQSFPELTVIMVTHNPKMLEFCDQVFKIENGALHSGTHA